MSHPTAIGSSTKRGFSFIELVVVIIILGVLVALLLPFFPRAARGAARRMHCSNNLKQLALAMHNYHDTYKSLPPAYTVDADGNRLHSWRTLLLPFLEQTALYEKIDLTKPIPTGHCCRASAKKTNWSTPVRSMLPWRMERYGRSPTKSI